MKQIYIIFLLILAFGQCVFAQNNNEQETFKQNVLSKNSYYLDNVEISTDGVLILGVMENSFSMAKKEKIAFME